MDQECAGRVTTETLSRCTESSSVFWSTAAEREAGAHMLPNLSSWNCFRRREAPGSPLGLPAALSVPRLLSGLTRTSLVKAAGCVGPWYLDMVGCRGHWGACLWPLSQIRAAWKRRHATRPALANLISNLHLGTMPRTPFLLCREYGFLSPTLGSLSGPTSRNPDGVAGSAPLQGH